MDMQKIKGIAYPNGKQIVSIKDADGKVLWSAGGAVEVDDLWIGDGESVFFSKRTQPLAQAIVRGGCHISVDNPTPDNIGTIVCNNGEATMSNEGVISVSGSPSYFDLNEERYNLPNLFGGLGVQDEYNMLTGVITRNAQVYALRGSMDWVEQSIEGQSYFALPTASYKVIISTHFHQVGTDTPANVGEFVERNGYYVFNYDGVNDNIADFEDYLDECYAAGEAVLVVGKKFVSTIETDDAFDLQQINGKNVVNLFVNDEYSTIAIKFKGLYPEANTIWVETTDGEQPSVGTIKDSLGNTLTKNVSAYRYTNTFAVKANGDIYELAANCFAANTKRVWLNETARKWNDYPFNKCTNLHECHTQPTNKQGAKKVIMCQSAYIRSTINYFNGAFVTQINAITSGMVNCKFVAYYSQSTLNNYLNNANVANFRNFVWTKDNYHDFGGNVTATYTARKMALYCKAVNVNAWKNNSLNKIFKHQIFAEPTCWVL